MAREELRSSVLVGRAFAHKVTAPAPWLKLIKVQNLFPDFSGRCLSGSLTSKRRKAKGHICICVPSLVSSVLTMPDGCVTPLALLHMNIYVCEIYIVGGKCILYYKMIIPLYSPLFSDPNFKTGRVRERSVYSNRGQAN